jgi:Lon protease-like protein
MENIPLFCLPKFVVLPGIVMPLHIFEPRYVQMIEKVISSSPQYLVISQMYPKDDVDYFLTPPFEKMGCLAEVIQNDKNNDGTYEIMVIGLERVLLEESKSSDQNMYRSANIDILPYNDPQRELDDFIVNQKVHLLEECKSIGVYSDLERLFEKYDEGMMTARACLHIIIYFFTKDSVKLQELLNEDSNESIMGLVIDLT